MIKRLLLFALWSAIGLLFSLELLYAFTPFGLAALVLLCVVVWLLDRRGVVRAPEAWGLLAGPGLFCGLVALDAVDSTAWLLAAGSFVVLALVLFLASGRARCAAGDLDAA